MSENGCATAFMQVNWVEYHDSDLGGPEGLMLAHQLNLPSLATTSSAIEGAASDG